jgi:hypothetical protein
MTVTPLDLARRLESDIRNRSLAPGHRYMTAEESARMLGTSVATANRALRILAERDIVVRRRNSGTFVGPALEATDVDEQKSVCIFAPACVRNEGAFRFDLIMQGIIASSPDVGDVNIGYVPAEGAVAYVKRVVEPIVAADRLAGVIATSCPREVYRYLGDRQLPLVVMGSLYADQPYLSIDADERAAGQLLISHLIDRGHRRLALFSDSDTCPGDNYFRDGVSEALAAAGFSHTSLIWRSPGPEPAVLREQVQEVLAMRDRPTGFVVKLPRWADEIAAIVVEQGLRVPDDVEIVFKGFALGEIGKSRFPHACPSIPYRQIAELAGQMLSAAREQKPITERTVVIPYRMQQMPTEGVVD